MAIASRGGAQLGASEQCLMLIPVPSDEQVYNAFKSLARRWSAFVREQRLELEGGVVVTAGLTTDTPAHVRKLLDAGCWIIASLKLDLAGFVIGYLRASGHGGFKISLLDELRIEINGGTDLALDQIRQIFAHLHDVFAASCASATSGFAQLAADAGMNVPVSLMSAPRSEQLQR